MMTTFHGLHLAALVGLAFALLGTLLKLAQTRRERDRLRALLIERPRWHHAYPQQALWIIRHWEPRVRMFVKQRRAA